MFQFRSWGNFSLYPSMRVLQFWLPNTTCAPMETVGLAEARRLGGGQGGHVVCVIGDGALTGGMAYEGLNQAGAMESPITVVRRCPACISLATLGAE